MSGNRTEDNVMKMKNTVIGAIIAVTQSKWIRPALTSVALVVALLGVTGCGDDSGHHGNHGN
jgi:hypothetical protein